MMKLANGRSTSNRLETVGATGATADKLDVDTRLTGESIWDS